MKHLCLNWRKINQDVLECRTCSHFCKIRENQTGICGIRQNIKGKLYLLSYGHPVALNIDPIEKKPLFHFLPGSLTYSLGTLGCNLRCANCQNFDISQMLGRKGKVAEYAKINWGLSCSPRQIVEFAKANFCQSIAYTYNEPTIFLEYALDTMKLAKQQGLRNVWVSNGFMSLETLELIIPYLDAINVDIKSFAEKFYQTNCGAHLQPILENCRRLVKAKVWLEITTLIIPTLSDDQAMLKRIAEFIKDQLGGFVPWHLSAFSGEISWRLTDLPDTSVQIIKRAYQIAKKAGLQYVYAGNILNSSLESTYCPSCGKMLIKRQGYAVKRLDQHGVCPKCGEKIAGIF